MLTPELEAAIRGSLEDATRLGHEFAGLEHLSMGMSADYAVAVEEGATIVRVGTAIFGARAPRAAP